MALARQQRQNNPSSAEGRVELSYTIGQREKTIVDTAIKYLKAAVDLCAETGNLDALQEYSKDLSDAYELAGNEPAAFKYFKQHIYYKDSVFSEVNKMDLLQHQGQFNKELKEREAQIELLRAANKRNTNLSLMIGIGILAVVTIVVTRSFFVQRKLANTIRVLAEQQEVIIENRTNDLSVSNKKLRELIAFNAHQIREPLTRITGAFLVRSSVDPKEFDTDYLPLIEKAANDLDATIVDVLKNVQE
jgi:signal transduction histidine kinase